MSSKILDDELAAQEAQQLAEDYEYGSRHQGLARWLIPLIAASWSLFQLSLNFILMDDLYVRSIHLAFAIVLVFLSYPALRKLRAPAPLGFLNNRLATPWPDLLLAIVAGGLALYLVLDYEGIVSRQGRPLTRDIVAGLALIALLLEAARRALGPALATIGLLFVLYAFFAERLPLVLAFQNVSVSRLVSQLTLSTEGIYGVPLYVSASTVFLFVLFGAMLEKTGGGHYFVTLSYSLLGGFRGGPAKAAVLSSGLTGMVSGSSIANVVTTGTFTIPMMRKAGYPATKAAAVEVAASSNGQLMPPIMGAAAFIMAEYCGLTYFEVVRAAAIPAFTAYFSLLYITHLEACKLGMKAVPRSELPPFWSTLKGGAHYLRPLGLLLYLLIIVQISPERSAFWAIVALALTTAAHNLYMHLFRQREVGEHWLKVTALQLWDSLVAGGRNMMSIGVAVAAAGIIVGIVSLGPGQSITEVVQTVAGDNIYAILFLTAIASLVLGMGLPTTANYIVMASLTATVIVRLAGEAGFEVPIIAAHLFVFFFGILADVTPPVGLAAFAAAAIAKADPVKIGVQAFWYDMRTALLPFLFFFNTDLLLWGITSPVEMAGIFLTALSGMFAFAALTQGYTKIPNRWIDVVLLLLAIVFSLRPRLVAYFIPALADGPLDNLWLWRGVGLACFLAVYLLQSRKATAVTV